MPLAKQNVDSRAVVDEDRVYYFTPASAAEELDLKDSMYRTTIICDTTSYAGTVMLPNVTEAQGIRYTIRLRTDGGNDITVDENDDSEDWGGPYTLADANDELVVESDGSKWIVVSSTGL